MMLLYKRYKKKKNYKLNLDYFARSQISMLLKYIINERNNTNCPYLTIHGLNIIIYNDHTSYFNKNKLAVKLIIYDHFNNILHTNHINPYKHAAGYNAASCIQIKYPNSYVPKYKNFRTRIIYKIMNFPLGKLRLKQYQR